MLFNLDVTEETIPSIIERSRDIDAVNRRVVYLKPMVELGDFREISAEHRHSLLKSGLKDRCVHNSRLLSLLLTLFFI